MSSLPQIPPRPDGLHPAPVMPPRPALQDELRPKVSWSWYEALGFYLLAFVLAGLATLPFVAFMEPEADLTTIVINVVAAAVIIVVLVTWLSIRHPGWPKQMGLPEAGTWVRESGVGVLYGIGLFAVMALVRGLIALLLQAFTGEPVEIPQQVGDHLPLMGVWLTVLYAIVIAPIGEELFFRGVLFRAFRDRYGFLVGALSSAVGFGLIHYIPGPAIDAALLMIVMFLTGLGLCFIYEQRGTIVAPIAAHMTFNVIGIVLIFGLR